MANVKRRETISEMVAAANELSGNPKKRRKVRGEKLVYRVDDNIPVPAVTYAHSKGVRRHPLHFIKVGQSIFFPEGEIKKPSTYAYKIAKVTGKTFVVRSLTEGGIKGIRIWRTA